MTPLDPKTAAMLAELHALVAARNEQDRQDAQQPQPRHVCASCGGREVGS